MVATEAANMIKIGALNIRKNFHANVGFLQFWQDLKRAVNPDKFEKIANAMADEPAKRSALSRLELVKNAIKLEGIDPEKLKGFMGFFRRIGLTLRYMFTSVKPATTQAAKAEGQAVVSTASGSGRHAAVGQFAGRDAEDAAKLAAFKASRPTTAAPAGAAAVEAAAGC